MRILFIGESWLGSCARSLREALARRIDVELDEVAEDSWFPKPRARWLRALGRLTGPAYRLEFNAQVLGKVRECRPDVVMTYKGSWVYADLIAEIKTLGVFTVNVYPDCSPHAHGQAHRQAVGEYDLVISTKPYHPRLWAELYGYQNSCVFVAQGYDPKLHLHTKTPSHFEFDVVMVATYRAEYGQLMVEFAEALNDSQVSVAIGGYGWESFRENLPSHWVFSGGLVGRSYVSLLRKGRICIAPLTRDVVINGHRQPGDVDTTRTYELAAMHCFFIHRKTEFARGLYDEGEVPMFDDAEELANQIRYYLSRNAHRESAAAAAHHRAVPAYSTDARAKEISDIVRNAVARKEGVSR